MATIERQTENKQLSIDADVLKIVEDFANKENISVNEALKKLVYTADYIYEIKRENKQGRLLFAKTNKSIDEIVFK